MSSSCSKKEFGTRAWRARHDSASAGGEISEKRTLSALALACELVPECDMLLCSGSAIDVLCAEQMGVILK